MLHSLVDQQAVLTRIEHSQGRDVKQVKGRGFHPQQEVKELKPLLTKAEGWLEKGVWKWEDYGGCWPKENLTVQVRKIERMDFCNGFRNVY